MPPDPPEVVAELVEEELGCPLTELFAEFSETPVASASIGQVHRARLSTGEQVAVKVQRRDIARRVRVDLDILQGLAQLAERIPELEPYRPCASVAEFQRALRRELDFDRERRHMEEFRRCFAGSELVRIPRPFPEYSHRPRAGDGVARRRAAVVAAGDRRVRRSTCRAVARRGAELYLEMIFRHGFYHADPHPGNLVLLEGDGDRPARLRHGRPDRRVAPRRYRRVAAGDRRAG